MLSATDLQRVRILEDSLLAHWLTILQRRIDLLVIFQDLPQRKQGQSRAAHHIGTNRLSTTQSSVVRTEERSLPCVPAGSMMYDMATAHT